MVDREAWARLITGIEEDIEDLKDDIEDLKDGPRKSRKVARLETKQNALEVAKLQVNFFDIKVKQRDADPTMAEYLANELKETTQKLDDLQASPGTTVSGSVKSSRTAP